MVSSRRVSRTCGLDHPSPLLCVVEPGLNILVLLPSQTVTPLSPGRGGARAGAAGVRRVCGMSVGPRAICHVRLAFVFITSKAKLKKEKIRRARRAAWWPRCAARRWRAVDRGADSAAAPSHAARRVASSAPKQTRARGAAAAAKTSTPQLLLLFSSRLVLSQAHTRATCARVAAFAPRRTIRTGSQSARRRRAAAKCTTLTSLRCCCFGTP